MSADEVTRLLRGMLAKTSNPPRGAEPAALIMAGDEMLLEREVDIDNLKVLLDGKPTLLVGNQECKKLRDEIALLDKRWGDALDWARSELAKKRLAGQRARQAQRAYHPAG